MRRVKIELIGWSIATAICLFLLGVSFWNVSNQWHVNTDGMSAMEKTDQGVITGMSIGALIIMVIITGLVIVLGLWEKIDDAYATAS